MSDWKPLRSKLENLSSDELLKVIHDLYLSNDSTRKFLSARFQKGSAPLKKYKDQVQQALYPDFNSGDTDVRIRDAKKAISDFEKATKDPSQTLDLMIHFLEVGTQMMEAFGMDYESFYDSMESMFRKVFTRLKATDHQLLPDFLPRLRKLEIASRDTGYGYGDSLSDMMTELESSARRRGPKAVFDDSR